jgi:hypothetical protein
MEDLAMFLQIKLLLQGMFLKYAGSPYSASSPFPWDTGFPDWVLYRIQIGAFSKPVKAEMFRGLYPVIGERSAEFGHYPLHAECFVPSAPQKSTEKS